MSPDQLDALGVVGIVFLALGAVFAVPLVVMHYLDRR